MATWKQVILKDPITGEYLAPMGGNYSGGDADTLQSHPASDFLLKSEYTPVDLSEYLKTATADTKYAAASHTHTTGQISDLSAVLAGYAPASHTHEIGNINGLQNELNSLKSSVSEGKSLVAAAVTDKGVTTAADAAFSVIAANIADIETSMTLTNQNVTVSQSRNIYTFSISVVDPKYIIILPRTNDSFGFVMYGLTAFLNIIKNEITVVSCNQARDVYAQTKSNVISRSGASNSNISFNLSGLSQHVDTFISDCIAYILS